ncbi:unnamed protein product [Paramecium pentaurelia]|uniref:Uncharacterized protein n=1 Tax=Paramecium pentaurelia TaxID=43138 RepID=A0A8S1X7X5_9CILI|nr:unnamed protein product [Paramecium pentaurelia]
MKQNLQLIWIDSKFNSTHQQRLRTIINDCSFVHSTDEAVYIIHNKKYGDKFVVIVSSSQIYNQEEYLDSNKIVFCEDSNNHLHKFLENNQLLVLVKSDILELEYYVSKNIEFLNAKESLNLSFCKQVKEKMNYYHQIEETSFRFLLINQKLQQNYLLCESELDNEILNLTSEKELKLLKDSVREKEEKKGVVFTIFEKLIYYYTRDELYKKLNYNLAESNYETMKQIMCILFDGFSKQIHDSKPPKKLYRGINFSSLLRKSYLQTLEDLNYCYTHKKSMFWNTLTSASIDFATAEKFSKGDCKIIFEISLSENNPHPFLKLDEYQSEYQNEEEVILFPQFEFHIVEYRNENGIQYFFIKQVDNNFSMALDKNKREQYWLNRINNELKPKLKIINAFYQNRINYIIKNVRNFPPEVGDVRYQLKNNIDDYFYKLVQYLSQFYQNYEPHKEYLYNLLDVCIQDIKFEFIITDDFLLKLSEFIESVSELLINQFIKIIQQIFNLEDFKGVLIKIWSQYYHQQNYSLFNYNLQNLSLRTPSFRTKLQNWRQLQMEEIKTIQVVKYSTTEKMGYELTLNDGNKVFNNVPTFIKKIDGSASFGYSDKWQGQGKSIKTTGLKVGDVQKDIKVDLANGNYNLKNFSKNKVKFIEEHIGQFGQVGGMIGTTLVEVYCGQLNKVSLDLNGVVTIVSFYSPILPMVISGGCLIKETLDQYKNLKSTFKATVQLGKMIIKTARNVTILQSATYFGTLFGSPLGPIGSASGALIGGIIGGAAIGFIDMYGQLAQFKIQVSIGKRNKSIQKNGLLENPGVNPRVEFSKLGKQVKSLILIALSDTRVIWLAINIPKDQKIITENHKYGKISIRYPYIGPYDHESKVIFYSFGVKDENLNENTVIDELNNKTLHLVCFAKKTIKL